MDISSCECVPKLGEKPILGWHLGPNTAQCAPKHPNKWLTFWAAII